MSCILYCFSPGLGSAGLTVELDGFKGLFQPEQFRDFAAELCCGPVLPCRDKASLHSSFFHRAQLYAQYETELNVQAWWEATLQHFQMAIFSFNFQFVFSYRFTHFAPSP